MQSSHAQLDIKRLSDRRRRALRAQGELFWAINDYVEGAASDARAFETGCTIDAELAPARWSASALDARLMNYLRAEQRDIVIGDLLRSFDDCLAVIRSFEDVFDELMDNPEAMLEENERAFLEAFAGMLQARR